MQVTIGCEIISIDEENETAILNFRFTDENGKDQPQMVVLTAEQLDELDRRLQDAD
ncbi:hypothetical protein AB1K91_05240 [Terribacillus sp. 179-K 1B1 HS]|uniref:hypothetical protein n=1 Tax=Terribacillus sp. 179-K 1B1 HS TaxID=3142388 RepID=UPI00399FFE15